MKIKKIYRNNNVINGQKDLKHLCNFAKFPVFMGTTNQSPKRDKFFDMNWYISKTTGMIQLNPMVPLEILYEKSHDSGDVGVLWDLHHKEFAKFIANSKPKNVLEIGAGHGKLFQNIQKLSKKISWTIIEPNPKLDYKNKPRVIKGYFDKNFNSDEKYDTYVHSHTFEHIYNPNEFMKAINIRLPMNGKLIFSVPNLEIMLIKKFTNCINFEHTLFLTDKFIKFFLKKYGFKIVKKKNFKREHSLFYSCIKVRNYKTIFFLKNNLYKKNKKIFDDYIKFHTKLIKKLNTLILKKRRPIFLFGAHIFSQYLIKFGLKTKKLIYILDNDKNKQNKRLYGTDLFVKSPSILKKYDEPIVILKAGIYSKEIRDDIIKNINNKTQFI